MTARLLLAATVLALGLAWQGATAAGWIDPFTVPPPCSPWR